MYYIVIWDNTSGIIHESWLDSTSRTFRWPKSKNPVIQILKAEKPVDNWYTYNYSRISGPFETYDDAREFESKTLDVSTNDDEGFASIMKEENDNKKTEMLKRVRRKPFRYCTTSSDDQLKNKNLKNNRKRKLSSSSSSSLENDENDSMNKMPRPPTNYISQKNRESSVTDSPHSQLDNSPQSSTVKSFHYSTPNSPESLTRYSSVKHAQDSVADREKNHIQSDSLNSDGETNKKVSRVKELLNSSNKNFSSAEILGKDDSSNSDNSNNRNSFNNENKVDSSDSLTSKSTKKSKPQIRNISILLPSTSHSNQKSNSNLKRIEEFPTDLNQNYTQSHAVCPENPQSRLDSNHRVARPTIQTQQAQGQCCCYELKNDVTNVKRMVSAMYLILTNKDNVPDLTEENKIDFKFQIETTKQLDAFETQLQNESAATQYKRMVKRHGGESFDKHIRRALSLTFTDIMAYRMTWTGARNTLKVENKNYTNLIIAAIMEHWPSVDKSSIETVIKSWFQHAGDRIKQNSQR